MRGKNNQLARLQPKKNKIPPSPHASEKHPSLHSALILATTIARTTIARPTMRRVAALLGRLGRLLPVLPGILSLVTEESACERAQNAVVDLAAGVVSADTAGDGAHQSAVAFLAVWVVGVHGAVRVLTVLVALCAAGAGRPGFLLRGVVLVALGLAAGRGGLVGRRALGD